MRWIFRGMGRHGRRLPCGATGYLNLTLRYIQVDTLENIYSHPRVYPNSSNFSTACTTHTFTHIGFQRALQKKIGKVF